MAKKQIPTKGTKEHHHYERKLDANYKEALGRFKYILKGLRPIAKKMLVHHTVSPKPIKDLIVIQKNYMKFKVFCDLHKDDRKVRALAKKVNLYMSFEKTRNKVFSIDINGSVFFEGDIIPFEKLVISVEELLIYQDALSVSKFRDHKFTELHRKFHHIVSSVRSSVIYANNRLNVIYEKETKPSIKFSLNFRKKKR